MGNNKKVIIQTRDNSERYPGTNKGYDVKLEHVISLMSLNNEWVLMYWVEDELMGPNFRETILQNKNAILSTAIKYCNIGIIDYLLNDIYGPSIIPELPSLISLSMDVRANDPNITAYLKTFESRLRTRMEPNQFKPVNSPSKVTVEEKTFKDINGEECLLAISAEQTPSIRLGIKNVTPKLDLSDIDPTQKGCINFPLPDHVKSSGIMELSQKQVRMILPDLIHFAEFGDIPKPNTKYSIIGKTLGELKYAIERNENSDTMGGCVKND